MSKEHLAQQIREALAGYDDPQQPVVLLVAGLAAELAALKAQLPVAVVDKHVPSAEIQYTEHGEELCLPHGTELYTSPMPSNIEGWREYSKQFAKGEKCPRTLESAQAAWSRDQELIEEQRAEIAKHKQTINQLRQKLAQQSGANNDHC